MNFFPMQTTIQYSMAGHYLKIGLIFNDFAKFDTIKVDSNGDPFFIDTSFIFKPDYMKYAPKVNDWIIMLETSLGIWRSPYLDDILTELEMFIPWADKIGNISPNSFYDIFRKIPDDWSVSQDYLKIILEYLIETTRILPKMIRNWIIIEKEMREYYDSIK